MIRSRVAVPLVIAATLTALGCSRETATPSGQPNPPGPPSPPEAALPRFGHVVVVAEENHGFFDVVGNAAMPYLNGLIRQYGLATNYVADTHPSIDNYFMLTVGRFEASNDDGWSCTTTSGVVSDDNLVRELNAAGRSWKVYAEGIPSAGYTGCDAGAYAKRHNPFAYLTDVADVPAQAARMVDFTGNFAADLAGDTLPQFAFVVPGVYDDAHSGSLAQADAWLQANIDPLIKSALFQEDGLLVITFDEDAGGGGGCTGTGNDCGGRVPCVIVSPKLKAAGVTSSASYHHENVLRLVAEGLGLPVYPGRAATAANMADFF